ncbi:alanine--tRNA ligase [Kribbella sandramycini]|uniref:Alanine--tRNA ligase n=1 Tax=Kribbella sandramycini TaxID=60450 RepID=A0A7Y4L6M7_9ACTN|nr:alanine--tRNA ligase [Kribbella sandramycini]MBB6570144.1 alanyl-tRNA synthetase [Kribbella sandramycini]NOL45354.1 alanine--tRNA ligase [Kribbella sandramycini]
METSEIRRRFLSYFEDRGHTVVPSAPLPSPDPNLLFNVAGMAQFVPYFVGQQTPPYPRATSVQKCVRTLDIDEVGKTTRHGTFFQMNGNFSFGDYFKEQAVQYAWELVTKPQSEGGYGFDESVLYASVYYEDDEAIDIWKRVAGLPDDRIVRLGMKDNFWSMGIPGPCGPCSEILIDRGPEFGADRDWEAGDRYLEFWNLVFMQNIRGEGGGKDGYPILGELPKKNIDTGLGLERVAYLLQGVDNMYEIDEIFPVIEKASELTQRKYGAEHVDDVRFRVVADHVRSALMLIGDGVTPSNEQGGYVLRRLLRRAIRSMRLLGYEDPSLVELLPVSLQQMKKSYPELESDFGRISQVAYAEEEAFRRTLTAGTTILDVAVKDAKAGGAHQLEGAKAFQLHDTYGFPIDLTVEMAAEQGLNVDTEGFRSLMKEQRERAKADARAKKAGHADTSGYRELREKGATEFTGYQELSTDSQVRGLLRDGVVASSAEPGETVEVVLEKTPFYAESGGQIADEGLIVADGVKLKVLDVQRPVKGLIVHRVEVVEGVLRPGLDVQAEVDHEWRVQACQAHSGTHVVHAALRQVLGPNALQSGSYNKPGYLRLDFAWTSALDQATRSEIEEVANLAVRQDLPVAAQYMTLPEAREWGALALFGETYDEQVRVVEIGGPWSRELCGGTHVKHSSQVGALTITSESSVGAGVRRVEAFVGMEALHYLGRERSLVRLLSENLKTRPEELPAKVADLAERLRVAEKELEKVRAAQVLQAAGELAAAPKDVFGVQYVGHRAPDGVNGGDLRKLALDVRGRMANDKPAVVAVLSVNDGKPGIVVALNDTAREWRLKAGDLVRTAAEKLGGKGGGKDDVAQGGGTDAAGADDALAAVEHTIGQLVTG